MYQTSLRFFKKHRSFLLFLFVMFIVRASFADQYLVPSGSMLPTIHIGDRVFVDKLAYDFKLPFVQHGLIRIAEPSRGDVIVFSSPENSVTLVKRLIGIPGDHIRIDNGFVEVNGRLVSGSDEGITRLNSAVSENAVTYRERLGSHEFTVQRLPFQQNRTRLEFDVPPDRYFFMGDNRDNSYDSRGWGLAKRDDLKGRAIAVGWSAQIFALPPTLDIDRIAKPLD